MLDCSSALTWTATPFCDQLVGDIGIAGRDGVEILAAGELAGDRAELPLVPPVAMVTVRTLPSSTWRTNSE